MKGHLKSGLFYLHITSGVVPPPPFQGTYIPSEYMYYLISLAVFTKALCQLMEVMCGPLLETLENRLQVNLKRTAALETEKETLEKEVDKITAELQEST